MGAARWLKFCIGRIRQQQACGGPWQCWGCFLCAWAACKSLPLDMAHEG